MRIGVDLGDRGTTLLRHRVATPVGDYSATLDAVVDVVAFLEKEVGRKGTVGVGTPGAVSSKTGLVKNSNSMVLIGKRLDQDLSNKLMRPVRIANDANCFALSESVDGAAAGARVVFGIILGTGVGGGIVIDKQLVAGHNDIAGEWGHNPLPWPNENELPGAPCYCGKSGCVETFLSGEGLARDHRAKTGKHLTAEKIASLAVSGDASASECLNVYVDRLARGLTMVINLIDPDVIVIGGGLSNIARLYDDLPTVVATYAFSDGIDTRIVRAVHGDSSGVRGAAWLWPIA